MSSTFLIPPLRGVRGMLFFNGIILHIIQMLSQYDSPFEGIAVKLRIVLYIQRRKIVSPPFEGGVAAAR